MVEIDEDSEEFPKMLREVEAFSKAVGVPLDLSKDRFIISRKSIMKLILGIVQNEYILATNNHICFGCKDKIDNKVGRPFDQPDKIWDFCKRKKCPHLKIIRRTC